MSRVVSDAIVEAATVVGAGILLGGFAGGLAGLAYRFARSRIERLAFDAGQIGGVFALVTLAFDQLFEL